MREIERVGRNVTVKRDISHQTRQDDVAMEPMSLSLQSDPLRGDSLQDRLDVLPSLSDEMKPNKWEQ
jgi:hypothetical protein